MQGDFASLGGAKRFKMKKKGNSMYHNGTWTILHQDHLMGIYLHCNSLLISLNSQVRMSRDGIIKICRYLAGRRSLLRSFDNLLRHILNVLSESNATYRSKAIRAVTAIISSDPNVLGNVCL
jgi:hypothetical protein